MPIGLSLGMEAISSASYKEVKIKRSIEGLFSFLDIYSPLQLRRKMYASCDHGS